LHDSSGPSVERCWEILSCGMEDCKVRHSDDLRCWLIPHGPSGDRAPSLVERLSLKCAACPVFKANRMRALGKRTADRALDDTMEALFAESVGLTSAVERLEAESRSKSAQVILLSEVGRALQSTMELDEILLVVLTAVTAGDGLGFNRAFLFLMDEAGSMIRGRMAVGPTHPREAHDIWKAMEQEGKSLREILTDYSGPGNLRECGIMRMAERLAFPMDAGDNILAMSLESGESFLVEDSTVIPEAACIADVLSNGHFLVVPLVAEGKRLGAILADNFVTGRRIRPEDVRLLETFASQAALAIANASLHRRLQARLDQLEEAHEELSHNQLQLLRAERLVALAGLAASFIHDLKAPLVSIGLTARAAASALPEDDSTRKSLERIVDEVAGIEGYLKDLAKTTGRHAKPTGPVDITSIILDSLELVRGSMVKAGVEARLDFRHGDGRVNGTAAELRQLILNLLYNSVEAMSAGGILTVATIAEGDTVTISVEDTGVGISDEVKSRIFSLFFTTKPEGSGLGLFIANRIVRDYGGKISFTSCEGEGTCFSISLPVCERAAETGRAGTR
jgi:signal transduction histidine kinase